MRKYIILSFSHVVVVVYQLSYDVSISFVVCKLLLSCVVFVCVCSSAASASVAMMSSGSPHANHLLEAQH